MSYTKTLRRAEVLKNRSLWAARVLVILPVARLLFYLAQPCRTPLYYEVGPFYDPVNYGELIAEHTFKKCYLIWEFAVAVPVAAFLLLYYSKDRRRIAVPAVAIACTATCCLLSTAFAEQTAESVAGTSLTEIGSAEFNGHRYHLSEASPVALFGSNDVDTALLLHECNLNDTNCYGRMLDNYGPPAIDNPSLVVNDAVNQLEVWAEDKVVFVLDGDAGSLPDS